jgi:hypothetical protein
VQADILYNLRQVLALSSPDKAGHRLIVYITVYCKVKTINYKIRLKTPGVHSIRRGIPSQRIRGKGSPFLWKREKMGSIETESIHNINQME